MNQFTEKYKSLSNTELLNIIENPNDYQALAVEAAAAEINSRHLTDDELNAAKEELAAAKLNSDKKEQIKQKKIDSVKNTIDKLNPIQTKTFNTDIIINILSAIFIIMAISKVIANSYMLNYSGNWVENMLMLLFFLPLIVLCIGSILFCMRKKLGWILICFYICFTILNLGGSLILFLKRSSSMYINSFFHQESPVVYILSLLFFAALLWLICKFKVKEKFKISGKTVIVTIIVSTIIFLLYMVCIRI